MNIYEVAQKAGVSITTVSRVINGSTLVKPKTTQKVLTVIEELGYKPNIFAKGLTTNSIRLIGVLTPDVCDMYFSNAMKELLEAARAKNYDILLSHTGNDIGEKKKHIDLLLEKRVDGIILVGSIFKEIDNVHIVQAAQHVPIVMINSSEKGENLFSVNCDDRAGMYNATEFLIKNGRHKNIYIHGEETYSERKKLEGFRSAMIGAKLEPIEVIVGVGMHGGYSGMEKTLASGQLPDGVLCSEDAIAVGALKCLINSGIRVPEQVAVVGYNNTLVSQCTNPELASVDSKVAQISNYAFEIMYSALQSGCGPQEVVFSPEFVLRDSARVDGSRRGQ